MRIQKIQPNDIVLKVRPDKFYIPLPHQQKLHSLHIPEGEQAERILVMGYGGGKTAFGCAEMARLAFNYNGCRLLDVSPTYKMARRTTIETYKTMFRETLGKKAWRFNQQEAEFTFSFCDSIIWIGSGEDNGESLKGPNISHARIDEPFIQKRGVYEQVVARIRDPIAPMGIILTGTPEELNWGYDLINEPTKKRRVVVQAPSTDNPFIPKSFIENLYETYDERMVQAYVLGKFVSLDAKFAYYNWDANENVDCKEYDPALRIYFTLDFNVEPFCANVIQQHGDIDYIIDEIHIERNGTTERACEEFKAKYGKHKTGVTVTGDPAGAGRNTLSPVAGYHNFSVIKDALAEIPHFEIQRAGQVPIINSVNLTNGRLRNSTGQRRLFVHRRCKHTMTDFERVKRCNDGTIDKKTDANLTHHSDAIRYYLWRFRRSGGWGGA